MFYMGLSVLKDFIVYMHVYFLQLPISFSEAQERPATRLVSLLMTDRKYILT